MLHLEDGIKRNVYKGREQATVAYLSSSGEMGGAERMLLDLLASIRDAAPTWALHLIVPRDGPLRREASAIGVTTTIVPFAVSRSPK